VDERLEQLERDWRATGSEVDLAALLSARVRAGRLSPDALALAAWLGAPAALLAAPEHAPPPTEGDSWSALCAWAEALPGFGALGVEASHRAALAEAERKLDALEQPVDPADATPPPAATDEEEAGLDDLEVVPEEDSAETLAWVLRSARTLCETVAARLDRAPGVRLSESPYETGVQTPEAPWRGTVVAWLVQELRDVRRLVGTPTPVQVEHHWPRDEGAARAALGPARAAAWPAAIRQALRDALAPWVLGVPPDPARLGRALAAAGPPRACEARWEDMRGDARVRRCDACGLDVLDTSSLSTAETGTALAAFVGDRRRVRLFRRADGRLLAQDCGSVQLPPRALRTQWELLPPPTERQPLPLERTLSEGERDSLCRGVMAECMEEKWCVFEEDGHVWFHRSWSGICVYGLTVVPDAGRWRVADAWATADPDVFREPVPVDEHVAELGRLIDWLSRR
jgi:hypothetical protein